MLNNIAGVLAPQIPTPTGDYESIFTTTVGAGGASTIDFTSIPSTYKHLQIRGIGRGTYAGTGTDVTIRFNSDTGSNYTLHQLYGDGSAAAASSSANTTLAYAATITGSTAPASTFGGGVTDILDYANTNKYKTIRTLSGQDQNGAGGFVNFRSGLWRSTSAITSITLAASGGNFAQYSHFALYGIKG